MKSTSGYTFSLGSGIFSWASKKQATVAQSSAEAEYIAAAATSNQAIWLRRILEDIGEKQEEPTTIYCDNKSAIAIIKNPVQHSRTKHIDIKYHSLREATTRGEIELKPINVKNHEALEESLWDLILDEDLIPFPLRNCFWTVGELHGSQLPLLLLPNENALVGKIFDFLHWVRKKPKNDDLTAVVNLEIRKNVAVPVEEFASWISWFDEQKRIDPKFESEYSKAIRRPRDMSEVYQEAESLMARRPAKIVNGELQIVAVSGGKDDDGASMMAEESCSICLEEFSDGGRGTRLPCSHMFHENCIVRWLREIMFVLCVAMSCRLMSNVIFNFVQ
ncbi:UNVERIFIED_CONTAM: Retrovirus-related Pol polyprotein from transposon TNT 1-94 [Sesamum radiatum]|uniref:Retrovirus-related Pol polyprotein from transposon TNT 1-94 n=1 Tax=Sesamum radiatum TaxID=300843 RepID=A0AAW2MWK9_SESRA